MKRCALLSMDSLREFECYDHLLAEPLSVLGWKVDTISWRNANIKWNTYDAVIIRSPWDYQQDPERFMTVLETIDKSSARLANSLNLVRWNIDKIYLKDIQQKGILIVPTCWRNTFKKSDLPLFFSQFKTDEIIIKPAVSANADDTFWLRKAESEASIQALKQKFSNRPFIVQPFMRPIIHEGEFSLFYFDGTYSHAILKTPEAGDFRVQEEHGGNLKWVKPEPELLSVGKKAMRALPEIPLYARIDFVRTDSNDFALMEVELIEPSLYFNMDPESPHHFAKAFDAWMNK